MDEYLLNEDEIAESAIVCWEALANHEQESFKRVCRAQLAKIQPLLAATELKGRQEERQAIIEKLNYLSETYSLYIPEIRIHELRQSLGGT
jgi:hypothetical protein